MRITSNMIGAQQMAALQSNIQLMSKASQQVTSGKRLTQASDDPTAATNIMESASSLRALDQYKTNIQRASSRVGMEDSVLQQLGNILTRAKELGLSQAAGTADSQSRSVANAEVQQLFQQIVSLGNTKLGDEYLFGGNQTQTAPFSATGSGATLDYTTTTPQGQRSIQIGDGQTLAVAHDGKQMMLDTGVLDAVKQLSRALDPTSTTYGQDGINAAMMSLDGAFNAVQTLVGDVGAQGKQLDSTQANLDAYKTNLTTFKSDLEDVDIETAVTDLTNRQVAYQAAMLATSKVMGLTLADYLK